MDMHCSIRTLLTVILSEKLAIMRFLPFFPIEGNHCFYIKVSVKENEVPTEKNSSRASIFATKASYISN